MDYNKAALELHSKFPGKIAVQSLCECKDRDALSTAYTPGVAEPCRKIKANPDDVYTYTMKGRTVAVVTNGTAVLGLGNIGPEAGLPVMEGKCVLFKEFGGVDAFPICLNAKTKEFAIAKTMASFAIVAASSGVSAPAIDVPMKTSASRMASARPPVSLSGFVSSASLPLWPSRPAGRFG